MHPNSPLCSFVVVAAAAAVVAAAVAADSLHLRRWSADLQPPPR